MKTGGRMADVHAEVTKALPAVGYTGLTIGGVTLPDIVTILTGVYIVMQMAALAYKWWGIWRSNKDLPPQE